MKTPYLGELPKRGMVAVLAEFDIKIDNGSDDLFWDRAEKLSDHPYPGPIPMHGDPTGNG